MKPVVTVREHARLTTVIDVKQSLDLATVSNSAFDWLCQLSAGFRKGGASLVQVEDRRFLRLDNYVGTLETPCGTRLEILPKHVEDEGAAINSRALLIRMISTSLDLPAREAGEASLSLFSSPISEWVIGQFLVALDHLVKRGIRSDYLRVEAAEPYLRGQLDGVRQMRQPPGRQHIFQIRHDIFVPDRPENRLLKIALDYVCKAAQTPANWRLAHELRSLLKEIPASRDIAADFKAWRRDRLMAHYHAIRPWCELILYRHMPLAVAGKWRGVSMLFPMEKLFERYVAASLRKILLPGSKLILQAARHALCKHYGLPMFQLRPDMLVEHSGSRWILDAKWKRLDGRDRDGKYGLAQSDFYQLFAYGMKYLNGVGDMALVYPQNGYFHGIPEPFEFSDGLRLWGVAFDLESGRFLNIEQAGLPVVSNGG
ncbi:McrC family protein [Zoogloea sp.]|uniref:McrC family protein n=1 Tax=Zoogloea sp. TaxID=49181 RepID=UPI0035B18FE6